MTNNLYNKKHLVIVSSSKEKRKIGLQIEIETRNFNEAMMDLFIRIVDPDSLSFLFCLRINDDNFQELKQQQGLLVDLSGFGQRLVDLLELCLSEENSECPKYIMNLCGTGDLAQAKLPGENWTLNFVETNPFKHLTHLSLRFVHSDIDQFKNYLVECVHGCRSEMTTLTSKLKSTKSTLLNKLQNTEMALETVTNELQQQKTSYRLQLDELREHLKQLEDRLDCGNRISDKVQILESKLEDLEQKNKCLDDKNSKLETDMRHLKSKLENVNNSCGQLRYKIQTLQRDRNYTEPQSTIFSVKNPSSLESKVSLFGKPTSPNTNVNPFLFKQGAPTTSAVDIVTSKPVALFSTLASTSSGVSSTTPITLSSVTLVTPSSESAFSEQPSITASAVTPDVFIFGGTAPAKSESAKSISSLFGAAPFQPRTANLFGASCTPAMFKASTSGFIFSTSSPEVSTAAPQFAIFNSSAPTTAAFLFSSHVPAVSQAAPGITSLFGAPAAQTAPNAFSQSVVSQSPFQFGAPNATVTTSNANTVNTPAFQVGTGTGGGLFSLSCGNTETEGFSKDTQGAQMSSDL